MNNKVNKSDIFFDITKFVIFTAILILNSLNTTSQINTEWISQYNSSDSSNDFSSTLKIDGAGNIYLAGGSDIINGTGDCTLLKYNSSGILLWERHYNGPGNNYDWFDAITLDNAGNIYLTGSTYKNDSKYDCLTVKYNSSGVLQWAQIYNVNNFNDAGRSIALDNSGNVYVTGKSDSLSLNFGGFLTIKYNNSGVLQWAVRELGYEQSYDAAKSIGIDNSGNVYISGTNTTSSSNADYVTIKYNSNGIQQWLARYNGPASSGLDDVKSMVIDSLGNSFVTGVSYGANSGGDCATVKYNSNGVLQWIARYNGAANNYDESIAVALDTSGNVIITGITFLTSLNADILTVKYNSAGIQQWANTYNGIANRYDAPTGIVVDKTGNSYITGSTQTDTVFHIDFTTIKYNPNGIQLWDMHYGNVVAGISRAKAIQLDQNNNPVVTGYSLKPLTGYDIITVKYSQTVPVTVNNNELPGAYALHQNYPNPFNPTTGIKFDLPVSENVKITVYDITGKEVCIMADGYMDAGSYELKFDASMLASGTYFYKFSAGEFTDIKKMILIK